MRSSGRINTASEPIGHAELAIGATASKQKQGAINERSAPSFEHAGLYNSCGGANGNKKYHPHPVHGIYKSLPPDVGSGVTFHMNIREGLDLSVCEAFYKRATPISSSPPNCFELRILIEGRLHGIDEQIHLASGEASIVTTSRKRGAAALMAMPAGPFRFVALTGNASTLLALGLEKKLLGEPFRASAADGEFECQTYRYPKRLGVQSLAQSILDAAISKNLYTKGLRAHLLKAKSEELLCRVVERTLIYQARAGASPPLGPKDIDRLFQAREILVSQLASPPTIPELARRIGVNATKLKRGYRTLFGNSIGEYIRKARLDLALFLVESTNIPLSDISHKVGYGYQSNFTQAFRRHHGKTPREMRGQSEPSSYPSQERCAKLGAEANNAQGHHA